MCFKMSVIKYCLLFVLINSCANSSYVYENEPIFRHQRNHERNHPMIYQKKNSDYVQDVKIRHNGYSGIDRLLHRLKDVKSSPDDSKIYAKPSRSEDTNKYPYYGTNGFVSKPAEVKLIDHFAAQKRPYYNTYNKNVFEPSVNKDDDITDPGDDYEYDDDEFSVKNLKYKKKPVVINDDDDFSVKNLKYKKKSLMTTTTRKPFIFTTTTENPLYDDDDNFDDDYDIGDDDNDYGSKESRQYPKKNDADSRGAYQNSPPYNDPFSTSQVTTNMKWETLGTREKVERSRQNYRMGIPDTPMSQEAQRHVSRMSVEGACRWPSPRIISVQSVHPRSDKSYLPKCTVLHRCGEDTGCCRDDKQVCTAKHTVDVELVFHVTNIHHQRSIDKLVFQNDTECVCKDRDHLNDAGDEVQSRERKHTYRRNGFPTSDIDSGGYLPTPQPELLKKCECTSHFSAHVVNDTCVCDCKEGQKVCLKMKRGREYLSLTDRMCISKGTCRAPQCEFGYFKNNSGRCPRKQEKFALLLQHSNN